MKRKLTDDDVRYIRAEREKGVEAATIRRAIYRSRGVYLTVAEVWRIIRRERYASVPDEPDVDGTPPVDTPGSSGVRGS